MLQSLSSCLLQDSREWQQGPEHTRFTCGWICLQMVHTFCMLGKILCLTANTTHLPWLCYSHLCSTPSWLLPSTHFMHLCPFPASYSNSPCTILCPSLPMPACSLPMLACSLSRYYTIFSWPSTSVTCHINNASTTNLNKHIAKCAPEESVMAVKMMKWAAGSTYSCQRFWVGLVKWVVARCHPFSIVEDEQLCMLFTMLDPKVEIPSHHSVQHDILHLYTIMCTCLTKMLWVSCPISFWATYWFFTIGTYWCCACWTWWVDVTGYHGLFGGDCSLGAHRWW